MKLFKIIKSSMLDILHISVIYALERTNKSKATHLIHIGNLSLSIIGGRIKDIFHCMNYFDSNRFIIPYSTAFMGS